MSRGRALRLACALWMGLQIPVLWAQGGATPGSSPSRAAQLDAVACAACHGPNGQGLASMPRSPYLAGLPAFYMKWQMLDYANGTRVSPVMSAIAKALTRAQLLALVRHFAAQPRRTMPAHGAVRPPALGRRLALHGRWSRGIPACVLCHGRGGVGVGRHFPALAGQPAAYLSRQLLAFKAHTRSSGPLGLMKGIASKLSDRQMRAVSEYFASLSPAIHPRPRRAP